MNEREIDNWLTMEIKELSRNEEIFDILGQVIRESVCG